MKSDGIPAHRRNSCRVFAQHRRPPRPCPRCRMPDARSLNPSSETKSPTTSYPKLRNGSRPPKANPCRQNPRQIRRPRRRRLLSIEQHDEWEAGDRRYFCESSMLELRTANDPTIVIEEMATLAGRFRSGRRCDLRPQAGPPHRQVCVPEHALGSALWTRLPDAAATASGASLNTSRRLIRIWSSKTSPASVAAQPLG